MPGPRVASDGDLTLRTVEPDDYPFLQRGVANRALRRPLGGPVMDHDQFESYAEDLDGDWFVVCLDDDAGPGTEFDEERGVLVQGNDPEALVARTYADCSRADRELALSLRPREEPLAGVTTPVDVSPERFGSVRRTYVVCERDRAIPPAAQRRMIEDRGVDATASVEASHSPFLSVPVELVDALESVGLPD